MEEIINNERQDSIKVSKGINGKYGFEVKRYYDFAKDEPELVIKSMKKIYEKLEEEFKSEVQK